MKSGQHLADVQQPVASQLGKGVVQKELTRSDVRTEPDTNGTVLVVDDDEFARDLLSRRVECVEYLVAATGDGNQVPLLLAAHPCSLVLLDLVVPAISGREVLVAIRTTYSASELPVIMVTSKTEGHEIAVFFRRGTNDYVAKPLESQALLARHDAHVARQQAELALKLSRDELERLVEQRASGQCQTNPARAENTLQPFRRQEGTMAKFGNVKTRLKFAAVHASIHNRFNLDRHLVPCDVCRRGRSAALAERHGLLA